MGKVVPSAVASYRNEKSLSFVIDEPFVIGLNELVVTVDESDSSALPVAVIIWVQAGRIGRS